jgi:hypothetical protein
MVSDHSPLEILNTLGQTSNVSQDDLIRALLGEAVKRSIFVSYHHGGDRAYDDAFSNLFADRYEIIRDNSVNREIDSDNAE